MVTKKVAKKSPRSRQPKKPKEPTRREKLEQVLAQLLHDLFEDTSINIVSDSIHLPDVDHWLPPVKLSAKEREDLPGFERHDSHLKRTMIIGQRLFPHERKKLIKEFLDHNLTFDDIESLFKEKSPTVK